MLQVTNKCYLADINFEQYRQT